MPGGALPTSIPCARLPTRGLLASARQGGCLGARDTCLLGAEPGYEHCLLTQVARLRGGGLEAAHRPPETRLLPRPRGTAAPPQLDHSAARQGDTCPALSMATRLTCQTRMVGVPQADPTHSILRDCLP